MIQRGGVPVLGHYIFVMLMGHQVDFVGVEGLLFVNSYALMCMFVYKFCQGE